MREKTKVRSMYVLDGGSFKYDKGMMTFGRDLDKRIPVFVPFYAFDTEEGWFLYDTGWPPEAPAILDSMGWEPEITEENTTAAQLAKIGVDPADVAGIILSHMHADHVGGLREFPDSELYVQKDEYAHAYHPSSFNALAYLPFLFDLPEAKWNLLEGDGEIIPGLTVFLANGHTPGLQSLVVELPETGFYVLSADAAYLRENINDNLPPGSCWDPVTSQYSVTRLKALAKLLDAQHWPGHDHEFFTQDVKLLSEYK